jgi:hypothetical protein
MRRGSRHLSKVRPARPRNRQLLFGGWKARREFVAQVSNLLYRRFPIGGTCAGSKRFWMGRSVSGLESETAEWKSVLPLCCQSLADMFRAASGAASAVRCALVLMFLGFTSWGASGHVRALDGHFEGAIALRASEVQAGTNSAPWSSVLHLIYDPEVRTFPKPHRVVFSNGEEWRVEVASLSSHQLTVEFDLFGSRELPAAHLAMIEFAPDTTRPARLPPGSLYLEEGEPLPGKLLWIDEKTLALDSLFGVLTLPRERVVRYVFPDEAPAAGRDRGAQDEIRLVDGSIFQGVLRPETNQITLRHAALGELILPRPIVRSITKALPGAHSLSRLQVQDLASSGPLSDAPVEGAVAHERHDAPHDSAGGFLRSVTIRPKTRIAYQVPADLQEGGMLNAILAPIRGARGSAHLKMSAGGAAIFERHVQPGAAIEPVAVAFPPARELIVEVDHGERIGFPCGVRLLDAFLQPASSRNQAANP